MRGTFCYHVGAVEDIEKRIEITYKKPPMLIYVPYDLCGAKKVWQTKDAALHVPSFYNRRAVRNMRPPINTCYADLCTLRSYVVQKKVWQTKDAALHVPSLHHVGTIEKFTKASMLI